jgi:hypothetical protein
MYGVRLAPSKTRSDEADAASGAGFGEEASAFRVLAPARVRLVLRLVHPHEARRVHDGPRPDLVEGRRNRVRRRDVELLACGQPVGEAARFAPTRERLPERPGGTGDEQRPRGGTWRPAVSRLAEPDGRIPDPLGAPPPAGPVRGGMLIRLGAPERARKVGECGGARRPVPDVEDPGLVELVGRRAERRPPRDAERRPNGDRAKVRTLVADGLGRPPDLEQPAELLLARAAVVRLRDREGATETIPCFLEQGSRPRRPLDEDPGREDVRVTILAVAAVRVGRVELLALIQEALAREVVVQPDDVGRARVLEEPFELVLGHARHVAQPRPHEHVGREPAGEEVERDPAPFVLEVLLVPEPRRRVRVAEVVCLHELRVRDHLANRPHRQDDGLALMEQAARKGRVVAPVRIPVAVETAEARCGERLVDRRPARHPRVALGRCARVFGELLGELGVDEARRARPAAVVDEPGDRPDLELAQPREPLVGPRPVSRSEPIGRHPLP